MIEASYPYSSISKLCKVDPLLFTTEIQSCFTNCFVAEPFLMFVAAGPFTTSDSLLYEPLADLMKTVQNDKPDLLILVSRKKC